MAKKSSKKTNYLILGVAIVLILVIGFLLRSFTVDNETQQSTDPSCIGQFTSKAADLSFSYDKCKWDVSEVNTNTSDFPENDSYLVTMTQDNYPNSQLVFGMTGTGTGGGYPDCANVTYKLVNDNLVRYRVQDIEDGAVSIKHTYLTDKNGFAIDKLHPNEFEEFFTYMNRDAFDNPNMCWSGEGVAVVKRIDADDLQESYQKNFNVIITVDTLQSDEGFLEEADAFVMSLLDVFF